MSFAKNIKYLRLKHKLSQEDISNKLGYKNYTTVQKWESGLSEPNMNTIKSLAELFDVTMDELTTQDLTMPKKAIQTKVALNTFKVPVLGVAPCGTAYEAVEDILDYIEVSESLHRKGVRFALVADGDSMFPKIEDGDLMLIKPTSSVDSGTIAIIKVNGHEATCKKILINDNGVTLIPLNTNHEPKMYSPKEVEELPLMVCGKVMATQRIF